MCPSLQSPLRKETIDEADDGDGGDLLRVAVYLPNESLWRRLSSSFASPMLLPDLRQTQKARLGGRHGTNRRNKADKETTTAAASNLKE